MPVGRSETAQISRVSTMIRRLITYTYQSNVWIIPLLRDEFEESHVRFNALEVSRQVESLIGSVYVRIWKATTKHDAVYSQSVLQHCDNRDTPPFQLEEWFPAIGLLHSF